jgi:hypothetical protein
MAGVPVSSASAGTVLIYSNWKPVRVYVNIDWQMLQAKWSVT